jgi:hypothetical protein
MEGERLGKWVIFKELGRGGMGRVYLAQEEMTGRQAAIKVLAAELAQETGFLHRFQREIDALRLLDHPGIVRFIESGYENACYFYAMEYVDGQSLDEILLTQGRFPWQEVLDIGLQICPALRHVHDHGIIHRDIKPPNILRTSQGVIKLTDFGIAKVFAGQHLTATGGVIGTAEFLSPEQAAGKPATKRSDLYSLGVVLYTLLTARTPFVGTTYLDLLHKHRYAQFDPPRRINHEIPYEIDEIVCQLLEKEPEKRPPDCLVLGKQLDSIRRKLAHKAHGTLISDTSATVAESKEEWKQREPGEATLMSRLVRAELGRQNLAGPISRLLNRAWLLIPLLLLCVGTIIWAFWPPSMESLYQHGSKLMESERLADMREAWTDYLEPLNARFPNHPYQDQVKQFEQKLKAAEGPTEAQRFFLQGERLQREGDFKGAMQTWQTMVAVFQNADGEKEWVRRAERALTALEKSAAAPERWQALMPALERAAKLRDEGRRAEAEKIWAGIEELYRNDPWAADVLEKVNRARKQKQP